MMHHDVRRVAPPGTVLGPCLDCLHPSCAALRADASRLCVACEQPIGFDEYYFQQEHSRGEDRVEGAPFVMHRVCPVPV